MGFTQQEITEKREMAGEFLGREAVSGALIAELFAQTPDASQSRAEITADINETNDFISTDIERIEVEGKVATAQGPLSDAERTALTKALESEKFDEDRRAENAGMRAGRISITGAAERDKARGSAQAKARANEDARMQKLLALQAQFDALDAQISALDNDIRDILERHLSPEELDYLDTLSPEQRREEEMRLMRDKLEAGEITQAEFDAFKGFWDERAQKVEARSEVKQALEVAPSDTSIRHSVNEFGARAAEAAADTMQGAKKEAADTAIESNVDTGNRALQNDTAAFGFINSGNSSLGSGNPLSTSGTSIASVLTPGLGAQTAPLTPTFQNASMGEPAPNLTMAQADPNPEQENVTLSPLPGNSIS